MRPAGQSRSTAQNSCLTALRRDERQSGMLQTQVKSRLIEVWWKTLRIASAKSEATLT